MSDSRIDWRASPGDPCPVCGRGHGCSRTEDGLHFCLDAHGVQVPGWRYLSRCDRLPDFGMYRREGEPSRRAGPRDDGEREAERLEKWADFQAGDGAGLRPVAPGTDAYARLRRRFPNLSADALGALELVEAPGCLRLAGCPGAIERDAQLRPVGVNFLLPSGRKLSRGSRGLVVPTRLLGCAIGDEPPADRPPGWHHPVLAVEGWSDVLACAEMGLDAVGRPSASGGAELLARWALTRLPAWREVLVVAENDRKEGGRWPGRDGAVRCAQRLADELGTDVYWALPPSSDKDVRAYLERERRRKGQPAHSRLGHELMSYLLRTAQAVRPRRRHRPVELPARPEPPAPRAFRLDLPEPPPASACPSRTTKQYHDPADPGAVRISCVCCKRMRCVVCRRRQSHERLRRAEAGIDSAVRAGLRLAAGVLCGVRNDAARKRLAGAAGYVSVRLGSQTLYVCALRPGAAAGLGLDQVEPEACGERLRDAHARLADETPFDGVTRYRPVNLSRSWSRLGGSPLLSCANAGAAPAQEAKAERPAPRWRPHRALAVMDPEPVVELLRRFGIHSPLVLRPPPHAGGRQAWAVECRLDDLDGPARLRLLDALEALPAHPPPEEERERGTL